MAKQPERPLRLSEMMGGFWGMYDPEKMKEIFDPLKVMQQMKVMMPSGAHLGGVVDQNRRNFEAIAEANKAAAETFQDMLEKQAEIFSRMTAAATEYVSRLEAASGPEAATRNAEAYGRSVEQALRLMLEMAEAVRAANEAVFEDSQKRVTAALDELKR